jgi:hypothetical protein
MLCLYQIEQRLKLQFLFFSVEPNENMLMGNGCEEGFTEIFLNLFLILTTTFSNIISVIWLVIYY